MENTLEKHLDGLVKKYQEKNTRNAPRIGRAMGKLTGVIAEIEVLTERRDYILPNYILRDLKDIYKNVNEIEL